jgi:hypothetical protein
MSQKFSGVLCDARLMSHPALDHITPCFGANACDSWGFTAVVRCSFFFSLLLWIILVWYRRQADGNLMAFALRLDFADEQSPL